MLASTGWPVTEFVGQDWIDRTVPAGQVVQIALHGSDPDSRGPLTYELLPGAPEGARVDPKTGEFVYAGSTTATNVNISVRVTDSGTPALSATRSFAIHVLPPPVTAPNVQMFTQGHALSGLVLKFNGALDPSAAGSLAHYRLAVGIRTRRMGLQFRRVVPLRSAAYDPSTATVTLTLRRRVPLSRTYELNGVGLTDSLERDLELPNNSTGQSTLLSTFGPATFRRGQIGRPARARLHGRPMPHRMWQR